MSPAELARHDAADRVRVLDAAVAATRRGIAVRLAACACTVAPQLRNLARLERLAADARARHDALTLETA